MKNGKSQTAVFSYLFLSLQLSMPPWYSRVQGSLSFWDVQWKGMEEGSVRPWLPQNTSISVLFITGVRTIFLRNGVRLKWSIFFLCDSTVLFQRSKLIYSNSTLSGVIVNRNTWISLFFFITFLFICTITLSFACLPTVSLSLLQ